MGWQAEHDWLAESSGAICDVRGFYSVIGVNLSGTGENAAATCFANPSAHSRDDRTPSCSVSLISGAWNCRGCGETGNAYRAAQLAGYEDKAAARLARQYGLFLEVVKAPRLETPSLPGERQLREWRARLRTSPLILRRLQELKGWKPSVVVRLGLGWDGSRVTFPIRTSRMKICGVMRYLPGAERDFIAILGTKRELWPVPELIRKHHPLFLVEGEKCAVAVSSLGLKAVGVPGAGSWKKEWGMRLVGRRVVVLADCDGIGRQMVARVAQDVPDARIVDIEPSVSDGSDIGDWVREARREGGYGQLRRVLERLAAA